MTSLILLRKFTESQLELWARIKGWRSYRVSSFGRVVRIESDGNVTILKSHPLGGYPAVRIKEDDQRSKEVFVHRLVAESFMPNSNPKLEVNHKSGYALDPRLSNLEWVTRAQNIRHAFDNGLNPKRCGEDNHIAKLTNEQAREIYCLGSQRIKTQRVLAQEYGVSRTTVNHIVRRKLWQHATS